MAFNLLEELLKKRNLPALKKVDPNTQEVDVKTDEEREHRLVQSVLPAAVAGVYDAARSEAGLKFLVSDGSTPDWMHLFFGKNATEVKRNIEKYTGNSSDAVQTHFNSVAADAVKLLRENVTGADRAAGIRTTAGAQRDFFLPYLPAQLRIGILLDDNTMDDRMNKMEGPVSSFMHKMEKVLSGQESKDDADKKRDSKM